MGKMSHENQLEALLKAGDKVTAPAYSDILNSLIATFQSIFGSDLCISKLQRDLVHDLTPQHPRKRKPSENAMAHASGGELRFSTVGDWRRLKGLRFHHNRVRPRTHYNRNAS